MVEERNVYRVLWESQKERDHCIDGKTGSEWVLGKLAGSV
jgi:hypothetical protein